MIHRFTFLSPHVAEIVTSINTYRVTWRQSGWSWAEVVILVKKPKLFGFYKDWTEVSKDHGEIKTVRDANTQMPVERRRWFENAVVAYESRLILWKKEFDENNNDRTGS